MFTLLVKPYDMNQFDRMTTYRPRLESHEEILKRLVYQTSLILKYYIYVIIKN